MKGWKYEPCSSCAMTDICPHAFDEDVRQFGCLWESESLADKPQQLDQKRMRGTTKIGQSGMTETPTIYGRSKPKYF